MAEGLWYYARNDQQYGPVTAADLKQLADAGKLSPDDLLWREGMESWSTAVNLQGLFSPEPASPNSGSFATEVLHAAGHNTPDLIPPTPRSDLRRLLRRTQLALWTVCVLVVLAGGLLLCRAILTAQGPAEEAAAAAVFATFFVGAYVLARAGEKLARLLLGRRR